jgi:hypothetical protein
MLEVTSTNIPTARDRVPLLTPWWGGQLTHSCGPLSCCVYQRRRRVGGTIDEVRRDLTHAPTFPLYRSLRHSSGRKPPWLVVHTAIAPEMPALTGSGVVPLPRAKSDADLLPLHRQESLRRLQRYQVRRTSPPMRHTNPKDQSTC